MDEEVNRLRSMLGEVNVWTEPEEHRRLKPFMVLHDVPIRDTRDDENMLCREHEVGGGLKQTRGLAEAKTDEVDLHSYALKFADQASCGDKFCPLQAIAQFPYKYTSAARDNIVRIFFANGNLYEREWDFFYIWPPEGYRQKAILLLPATQIERFLASINNKLRTQLRLPDNAATTGLLVEFPIDGTPRPRYLGRASNRAQAESLKQHVPPSTFKPDGETPQAAVPTDKALEAFTKKIQLLLDVDKNKRVASKERKKAALTLKQKSWKLSIIHVQGYLGMRKKILEEEFKNPWKVPSMVFQTVLSIPDFEKPAPYARGDFVIFICVDVESYEHDHSLVTEVGIATLDTADIAKTAPGKGGKQWFESIHARHFRIKEYGHLHNVDFVHGCADQFRFGESEWISIRDAPHEISECFKEPYSKRYVEAPVTTGNNANKGLNSSNIPPNSRESVPKRNIILVGHDCEADIAYLRRLGYDPTNLINLKELIDTVSLYRSFRKECNPRSLGSILADLDIPAWYLHNGGNDAVYTLQAMIGIVMKAAEEDEHSKASEQDTQAETKE